jgi:hypothetical protein
VTGASARLSSDGVTADSVAMTEQDMSCASVLRYWLVTLCVPSVGVANAPLLLTTGHAVGVSW